MIVAVYALRILRNISHPFTYKSKFSSVFQEWFPLQLLLILYWEKLQSWWWCMCTRETKVALTSTANLPSSGAVLSTLISSSHFRTPQKFFGSQWMMNLDVCAVVTSQIDANLTQFPQSPAFHTKSYFIPHTHTQPYDSENLLSCVDT